MVWVRGAFGWDEITNIIDGGNARSIALGLRLGEGSGAALAIGVLKGALACHSGMATFAEAGVSDG